MAGSVEELESPVLYRLENPEIEEKVIGGRKMMFGKYVSSFKADATENYTVLIKKIVKGGK